LWTKEEDEAETGGLQMNRSALCLARLTKEKKMKRVLLTVLLVGLLAGQASAGMYTLTDSVAKDFRQKSTAIDPSRHQLYLVIDTPGTPGSYIDWQYSAGWDKYGPPMKLDVVFLGQLADTEVMQIGKAGDLAGYDSFGMYVANDDDDWWSVRPYLKGATYTPPSLTNLDPGALAFISLSGWTGTVTEFGFELNYEGQRVSDNFHVSVVPIPAALILGLLGMGAAGLKLRRFALRTSGYPDASQGLCLKTHRPHG